MNKLKSKLQSNKGTGSGSTAVGITDTIDLNACEKFYIQWEPKMMNVLRPGHHFHSQAPLSSIKGKVMKQENYSYVEKSFVSFLKKSSDSLGGHLREAIQAMATTYQQIADLKSQRDSNIRTEVFNPIQDTTQKELTSIQRLRKAVTKAQDELAAAEKNQKKDGGPQATNRRDLAFRAQSEAKEKLNKAVVEFQHDEPKRIALLQASAEAQLEYHKWALEAFTKLVSELKTIRGKSLGSAPEATSNVNFNGGAGYYDKPQTGSTFSTMVERKDDSQISPSPGSTATTKCQALYDFEAEQDDDLSLKKGDIATIIRKVDDQWYYGEKNGRQGHFPIEFVREI